MSHTITLRDVDESVIEQLRKKANSQGEEFESFLKKVIKQIAFQEEPALHHDLDYLAGTWSETEYKKFHKHTEHFSKIDDELWQ